MRTHTHRGSILSQAIEAYTEDLSSTGREPDLADLAEKMRVDLGVLQQVVPDVEKLLVVMAENATRLQYDAILRLTADVPTDDPMAQFQALAEAYIEWGSQYPREFKILASMPTTQFAGSETLMRYEVAIDALMIKVLQRAEEQGQLSPDICIRSLISIARTFASGVVSKMLSGDLSRWNPGMSDREAATATVTILLNQFLRK